MQETWRGERGADCRGGRGQPPIMDDNVIGALVDVTRQPWTASAVDYVRYRDFAADWAYELQTEPDVMERRLFRLGQ